MLLRQLGEAHAERRRHGASLLGSYVGRWRLATLRDAMSRWQAGYARTAWAERVGVQSTATARRLRKGMVFAAWRERTFGTARVLYDRRHTLLHCCVVRKAQNQLRKAMHRWVLVVQLDSARRGALLTRQRHAAVVLMSLAMQRRLALPAAFASWRAFAAHASLDRAEGSLGEQWFVMRRRHAASVLWGSLRLHHSRVLMRRFHHWRAATLWQAHVPPVAQSTQDTQTSPAKAASPPSPPPSPPPPPASPPPRDTLTVTKETAFAVVPRHTRGLGGVPCATCSTGLLLFLIFVLALAYLLLRYLAYGNPHAWWRALVYCAVDSVDGGC